MAVSTSWYIPGKVTLTKISGAMTVEDLEEINSRAAENRPATGWLHQLLDITEMTKPPTIGMLRNHSGTPTDRDGFIVVIGNLNRIIEFTITTAAQFTNIRMLVAQSAEEAIAKLRNLDPSLSTSEPSTTSPAPFSK